MGAARAYEVYQFALTHYCLPPTGQRLYYYRWIPSPQSELRRKNVVPLIQALTSLGFYNLFAVLLIFRPHPVHYFTCMLAPSQAFFPTLLFPSSPLSLTDDLPWLPLRLNSHDQT